MNREDGHKAEQSECVVKTPGSEHLLPDLMLALCSEFYRVQMCPWRPDPTALLRLRKMILIWSSFLDLKALKSVLR